MYISNRLQLRNTSHCPHIHHAHIRINHTSSDRGWLKIIESYIIPKYLSIFTYSCIIHIWTPNPYSGMPGSKIRSSPCPHWHPCLEYSPRTIRSPRPAPVLIARTRSHLLAHFIRKCSIPRSYFSNLNYIYFNFYLISFGKQRNRLFWYWVVLHPFLRIFGNNLDFLALGSCFLEAIQFVRNSWDCSTIFRRVLWGYSIWCCEWWSDWVRRCCVLSSWLLWCSWFGANSHPSW